MSKKSLTEADICTKFITPSVVGAGWDLRNQIRQEVYFTAGRIIIKGDGIERGERKRADYILYYKGNIPIAIIEAKDNNHSVGAGMQQALEYGKVLDIPFVYSSNGDSFIEHDTTGKAEEIEREIPLDNFPSPEELWRRYKDWKGITEEIEPVLTEEYYTGFKKPRYYQEVAINRTVEAISKGKNRILLVMATGTGKTYVASQVIYKLWKSKKKKRILFLADRNILVDQARNNDFKHFKGAMTKITNRKIDTSYEIYLALYQAVTGVEEWRNIYKQFSREFFDLVIVDECHRGSAAEDSAWREVLEYFESATQIGMTATPKESKEVSNIDYFGGPIYIYSLKQGIQDGFLSPYKVIRISIDKDVEGYRPEKGKRDKYGNLVPDKIYDGKDFDRDLVIDERTKLVAKKVTEFLKKTNRLDKTIVFCVDIEHAERMRRALVNENKDLVTKNPKYIIRITGDDESGKRELDNFIDPSVHYPVIVTTSKLLNTGVDVQTCKLIVLDSNIQSVAEFKQIIGRGTRVREDYGKYYFTIMDFRQVTNLFADPDFDGEPVQSIEFKADEIIILESPPEITAEKSPREQVYIQNEPVAKPRKYYVNGVEVKVLNERVQMFDKDGKLITQSLKDYTKQKANAQFRSLDDFLQKWKKADQKSAIIKELIGQGIFLNELREEVGKDFDDFDLICHVAFDQKLVARKERASKVKKGNYFARYGQKARAVVNALLDKYSDEGIENMESMTILKVNPFPQFGTPLEIVGFFGGKEEYFEALHEIENQLYR
ncbi:MAG: DEAD/DEAH box helicase family protein [Candidatus Bathyarchaeia archaeon]|jgi:type I restriction enzyme R subunit